MGAPMVRKSTIPFSVGGHPCTQITPHLRRSFIHDSRRSSFAENSYCGSSFSLVQSASSTMGLTSLAWPSPFPRRLVGGAGGGKEGRRVWWLWTRCCWLCRNVGRANQIEAASNLWHDFRFERVTRFWHGRDEKIQDCLLSSFTARLLAVDVQTKRR